MRTHFRTNLFFPAVGQDCQQVWFAGVHCDIGGGYPEKESGLSKLALQWMAAEAQTQGLLIDLARFDEIVLGVGSPRYVPPDPRAELHQSLRGAWRLVEHLPRRYIDLRTGTPVVTWRWAPISGFYRHRQIAEGTNLHSSVVSRLSQRPDYQPVNLPKSYAVVP